VRGSRQGGAGAVFPRRARFLPRGLANEAAVMDPVAGAQASPAEVIRLASRLASQASLEMGAHDLHELEEAREHLSPGQRIFVSHLPGQTWSRTLQVCSALTSAGFDPVPHIPVRLLENRKHLAGLLSAACDVGVREPLLISGDYDGARGEFDSVLGVLRSGALRARGLERVSLAGHPEGHPRVPWDVICQAQVDKWRVATADGLRVRFVTQFFFSAAPFVQWARFLRAAGVEAGLLAGVAGPTGVGRLIKLAKHCGVGASLRALTSRPASFMGLLADHDPRALLTDLAAEKLRQDPLFDGVHFFSLGGFLRTVRWRRDFEADPRR
jgi:methylenetetrahydrofolate reductase (NADPH)